MPLESTTSPTAPLATSAKDVTRVATRVVPPVGSVGALHRTSTMSPNPVGQVVRTDVELDVAEAVGPQRLCDDRRVVDLRQRDHAREQQIGVDGVAQFEQVDAVAQRRRRRSEHVAPVEGGAGRFEPMLRIVQLDRTARTAGHRHGRGQQPVVGADEHPFTVRDLDGDPASHRADARIDDRHDHSGRDVADRAGERERPGADVERATIPWVRSITVAWGASSRITDLTTPTNSSSVP